MFAYLHTVDQKPVLKKIIKKTKKTKIGDFDFICGDFFISNNYLSSHNNIVE